ncbi:ABC transporter C family protein [Dictyostelium discoideum AX4]|uniref:ABC transporter C family member 6 n=1 Tax=Dictyostelium discoideum TaxID=44689 RepID=ABCC6_DICDI|nr:ABC transporter C family protein [Dictyostelium discoideum AX4]Q8T6H3.1 RecName: Full=ABC transporter C family member 6; AltName: Full=ABC transporter ABCC.6 [Dictyostelium discoideum]AAL85709.1 ABC transporter ABCC.6 [Dictyostelium discoideum]EAL63605.1 ABC transporter C family protein [Dictyostelium discoideum AX4]|eukprot:XP_637141.1 ABC transporter C family protein [Dictyostelium discoideum AX4]
MFTKILKKFFSSYEKLKDNEDENEPSSNSTNNFYKTCPEDNSSKWSKISFNWVTKLIMKGYLKESLEMNDIYDLPELNKVQTTSKLLEDIDLSNNSNYTLIKHIYKKFLPKNKYALVSNLFIIIFTFLSPICLKFLINYISIQDENEKSILKGILLCCLLCLCVLGQSISQELFYWFGIKNGFDVRGALAAKIFEKTLKLSNASRKEYKSGKIMNIMSIDVANISEYFWTHHINIVSHFIQILSLVGLLCYVVGPSGLVGFGVMVIALPINAMLCAKSSNYLEKSLEYSDSRTNLTSELITNIRPFKMYAWENFFINKIDGQRKQELKNIFLRIFYSILDHMMIETNATLVLVSTFATYSLNGNTMSLDVTFTAMTIFSKLEVPLIRLPYDIFKAIGLIPSVKRVQNFLKSSESLKYNKNFKNENQKITTTKENNNQHGQDNDIIVENCTFQWNEPENNNIFELNYGDNEEEENQDESINKKENDNEEFNYKLKDINLIVPKGKLTMICGVVGSGKTSLIFGLIGEIYKLNGSVSGVPNNISFTSQQPFLLSASLRENILFGNEFDIERYKKVIESTALTKDIVNLAGLDLTEIGERGINLSGGQKQRISLARALYANSDCFIFDEPLSAVDPEVASHLFDHCIQGELMRNKTRILVTHQLQFIPYADHIIVLNSNGQLIQGTYQELNEKGIDFKSILKTKEIKKNVENETDSEELIKNEIEIENEIIDVNNAISDKNDPNLIEKAKLLVKEDKNEGEVEFNVYKKYFSYGSSGVTLFITISLFFVGQAIFKVSDFWLTIWTERSIEGKSDSFYIGYYLLIFGTFVVILMIRILLLCRITFNVGKNLHSALLKSVTYASCRFFDTNPSGRILNRFSKDTSDIDIHMFDILTEVSMCFSELTIGLISIVFIIPIMVIPLIILSIAYYILQRLYRPSARELNRWESITVSPIFSLLQECYNGLLTIRTYKQESRFIKEMFDNININLGCFFYSFAVHRWVSMRLEVMGWIMVFFTSLIATLFISNNGLAALSVTTALSLNGYLSWGIRRIVDLEVKMNSFQRIQSYIEIPKEGNKLVSTNSNEVDNHTIKDADLVNWPNKGIIEFKNVEIKYRPNSEPNLKDLSFKVQSSEKIGIVGRTGAGKTTIASSLFRMVECSKGLILIDGIDISKVQLQKLRSSIGIVPQDPFIFTGTIRSNIDPFNEFTDFEIWESVEKVKLKDAINSMPLKLETALQENGDNGFSYGQKQLLCLCRTILKNFKIILMDEATSSIDYHTAQLIKQTIQENFKDCTTLTIAHRLETIIDCNKIAVIDSGQLIEFDTPSNLMNIPNSKFNKLIKSQTDYNNNEKTIINK